MSSTGTLSLDRFSPDAKAWVVAAQQLADESQHAEVTPLHLLHTALDRNPAIAAVFEQAGKSATKILALTGRALAETPKGNESAYLSAGLLALLRRAERDAERAVSSANKEAGVDLPHLLNALTQEIKGPTADILGEFDLGPGSLKPHLATLRSAPTAVNPVAPGDWAIEVARSGASSAHGDPVIGREEEIQRVLTVLERREQCNPILIGETGIGKAAIVRGVLQRVNASRVPSGLGSARWLEPDLGALASLARTRLEADVRFKKLIDSQRREQPLILVLTSIVRFLGSAPGATIALGDALTSALERRTLRVLATTSVEGWSRITSKEPMLARLFTPIPVDEPNLTQATDIVRGLTGRYEQHHKVEISEPAVTLAVQLAKRYIPERALPESALGLLDESAAARRVAFDGVATDGDRALTRLASLRTQHDSLLGADDTASVKKRAELMTEIGTLEQTSKELEKPTTNSTATPLVGEQEVAATLAKWTQIPVAKMLEAEAEKLLKMEERLARRVVGQQAAVEAIARAVRRGRVGLRDPRRPIGSFLFLGTSGVGKTELAKAL
ncbi:MAG TPA: Clp protease N-terminal domain-containing protein, partial [Polyangiaceae bacterium]|nr:Clp protease N-terminal domain-containing protein [Polyangiaceae bacterium]